MDIGSKKRQSRDWPREQKMLNFLKRLVGLEPEQADPPVRRRRSSRKQSARDLGEPIPVPDVVEGNDQTDWDLWKDSVDSQMHSLSPEVSSYPDTAPSELNELDPFHRVGKNRDS
ncbi:MAG: hypothetical protein JWQ07_3280 [Ramlibacter sp.]|nr:hypothetical protein [Ramlibacter sp.]